MKLNRKDYLLYAITDRMWLKEKTLYQQVEEALRGGVSMVQLREKELSDEAFFEEAVEIQGLCRNYKVPFLINDNIQVALKVQADGLHIGQRDISLQEARSIVGNNMTIGVSAINVEQAMDAQQQGADYIGVGAVFPTDTKKDADFVPYAILKAICHAVSIPVVAIGGISKNNMKELRGTGISGVSLISAIFAVENIEAESALLRQLASKVVEF